MPRSQCFEMTRRGEIIPFEPPVPWLPEEEVFPYLQRIGFGDGHRAQGVIGRTALPRFSDTDGLTLEWHSRVRGEGHQYLAIWTDVVSSFFVWVPDWPTLIKLQAIAAPIASAGLLAEIHSMLSRVVPPEK